MQNFETVVQINEIYRMKNKVETFDSTNSNIPFSVRISCVCAELSDAPLKIMFKQKVWVKRVSRHSTLTASVLDEEVEKQK